jgi:hypothetical protein
VPGINKGWRSAFFAPWFLTLAGIRNGVADPALAIGVNGYFPGLMTSPLIAGASCWLCIQLLRGTEVALTKSRYD